jgi:hypothetical protein
MFERVTQKEISPAAGFQQANACHVLLLLTDYSLLWDKALWVDDTNLI